MHEHHTDAHPILKRIIGDLAAGCVPDQLVSSILERLAEAGLVVRGKE